MRVPTGSLAAGPLVDRTEAPFAPSVGASFKPSQGCCCAKRITVNITPSPRAIAKVKSVAGANLYRRPGESGVIVELIVKYPLFRGLREILIWGNIIIDLITLSSVMSGVISEHH
jgi:energy-converting hydrogenase Eha subunit F